MKALSIRQPYAWLIAQGHKNIENRQWSTAYRGDLLIHASKTIDQAACTHYAQYYDLPDFSQLVGGIVGKAILTDVVTSSDSIWFQGKYGFVLRDACILPFQILRGALHLFDVDATLLERVEEAAHV